MDANDNTPPKFEVLELLGTGDPYFGGSADDRPLGTGGTFLRGCYSGAEIAQFATRAEAEIAASKAERRKGSILAFAPVYFAR